MPFIKPGLTVKSLAEVAWLVSRVGRRMIETGTEPSAVALRELWQNTRALQQHWTEFLDSESIANGIEETRFDDVAAQLFNTELLTRVWATILGLIDQRTGRNDLTRIAANVVSGLLQVRNRLVSHLLAPAVPAKLATDLDRLRRRCDRWTDLLIGSICGRDDCFQFAFNPDRARDFASEARESDPCSHPVELLVAAGVRLSLLGQLPDVAFDCPAFEGLLQSILGSIPEEAFYRDGSLRDQLLPNVTADEAVPDDDVRLPGIRLSNLHHRFN